MKTTPVAIVFLLLMWQPQLPAQEVHYNITVGMQGSTTMHDGTTFPIWGFREGGGGGSPYWVPGPTIRAKEGEQIFLHLQNTSPLPHTIHPHGLDVPQEMDGVPSTSFDIGPGETYTYEFTAPHPGSYIYHCHVHTVQHMQMGMYGAVIIDPADGSQTVWQGGPAYDEERIWVIGEYDSYWHTDGAQPGEGFPYHDYNPDYFIVNGESGTDIPLNPASAVEIDYGNTLLIRAINVGFLAHRLRFDGLNVTAVGSDGRPLPAFQNSQEFDIYPGERFELIVDAAFPGNYTAEIEYLSVYDESIQGTATVPIIINGELQSFNKAVQPGWNLIGLPFLVADPYYLSIFPNALENSLFSFNGSYTSEDNLIAGNGYWLNFPSAEAVEIQGVPIGDISITMQEGWNLISPTSCDVALADINDPGNIITPNTLFGFNGGYVSVDTLKMGNGYWLNANSSGQIELSCGGTKQHSKSNSSVHNLSKFPALKIIDAAGSAQMLYFNLPKTFEPIKAQFSLPPIPPANLFDARFLTPANASNSQGYRISTDAETFIRLQTNNVPITVKALNIPVESNGRYFIQKQYLSGKDKQIELENGKHIRITNPKTQTLKLARRGNTIPTEFVVLQNYPNPFNPSTEIRFGLPQAGKVQMIIYDIRGQKIRSLLSNHLAAGFHTVEWDGKNDFGQNVASGIYFYKTASNMHTVINKMVLIR